MLSTIGKTVMAGAIAALGLGFGANEVAADSFSVSVHTPTVSAGYSTHHGHNSGFVDVRPAPAPVVVYSPPPAPVVVRRAPAWAPVAPPPPVVVVAKPRHVCSWDRVPVTRVRYDDCGRRIYYTEYVKVRACDDYHRGHGHHKHGHGHHKYDDDHHHKHGKYDKHHKHHDHDDDYKYSRRWDDDDRHDNRRGRNRD